MIFLHFFGRIGERCHRGCEWSHAWNLDHIFIHVQRDQRHKPKSKILWSWNRYDPVKLSGICSLDFPSGGSRDFVQDITQGVWKPEHFTPISGTDTAWNLLVFSTFVHLAAGKAPILLHKSYCWWYIHKSPQDGCWKIFIFTGKKIILKLLVDHHFPIEITNTSTVWTLREIAPWIPGKNGGSQSIMVDPSRCLQ